MCLTHTDLVVYAYKTRQNSFVFLYESPTFWYPGIFWEMHVLILLVYLGIAILRKRRTHSKHFKLKQHLSCTIISYGVLTHIKRGPSDPWIAHLSHVYKL